MQDEVKVSQALPPEVQLIVDEVTAKFRQELQQIMAKDEYTCLITGKAIESWARQFLARHRHQAERETLARMEPGEVEPGEVEKLREQIAELRAVVTNDEGLLSCPKCHSLTGPYLYWWQRGQAWIVICGDCKHEAHARESTEYAARNIWNDEARAALPPAPEAGQ